MTYSKTRQSPRVVVRLSAELKLGGQTHTVVTRNVSLGGVCLEGGPPLAQDAEVRIALFLVIDDVEDAVRPPLDVRGKVAWCTPAEGGQPAVTGIEFLGLSAHQQAGLGKYLKAVGA